MPRIVDAEQRREHVVDAVLRLVDRGGVSAASLRNVADEAGLNVGSVRHYFTSHHELLLAAATTMADRATARIERHLADFDESASDEARLEVLLDVLMELLPADDARRTECVIFLAFAEHSRTMASLQSVTRELFRGPRELAHAIFGDSGLSADDTRLAIDALAATVDGLTLQGVHESDRFPPERMREVLRWQIRTTFAGHPTGAPASGSEDSPGRRKNS